MIHNLFLDADMCRSEECYFEPLAQRPVKIEQAGLAAVGGRHKGGEKTKGKNLLHRWSRYVWKLDSRGVRWSALMPQGAGCDMTCSLYFDIITRFSRPIYRLRLIVKLVYQIILTQLLLETWMLTQQPQRKTFDAGGTSRTITSPFDRDMVRARKNCFTFAPNNSGASATVDRRCTIRPSARSGLVIFQEMLL